MMTGTSDNSDRIEQARQRVHKTLTNLRAFQAQDKPSRLTEADTKAHFIEPIIASLGWTGIGTVTREYYVRNSQEFIDYVMFGPRSSGHENRPLLAIEAKAIHRELSDKHAAQLVQYCAVEGIEWAALTNGRELHFFNTFLRPDLEAKRILKLDLLAFNTESEFVALFGQLWRLSRESLTEPTAVRSWLNQLRLDAELRQVLSDPTSPVIRQLQNRLEVSDIRASANDITSWFHTHLSTVSYDGETLETDPEPDRPSVSDASPKLSDIPNWEKVRGIERWHESRSTMEALFIGVAKRWPEVEWQGHKNYIAASSDGAAFLAAKLYQSYIAVGLTFPSGMHHSRIQDIRARFNWKRIQGVIEIRTVDDLDDEFFRLVGQAMNHTQQVLKQSKRFHRVALADLIQAGLLHSGGVLVLKAGQRVVAEANLTEDGQIAWQGQRYRSLSDKAFAQLLGPTRTTLNGWRQWHARLDGRDILLADLRTQFEQRRS